VVSGNGSAGVEVDAASQNVVAGNDVGTDASGMVALGNAGNGVQVDTGAADNTIGGLAAAERNVISGNGNAGADINGAGTTDNAVDGNLIGTDVTGGSALGNGRQGVLIDGASGNIIGGTAPGGRNLVSGNGHAGILIINAGATGNIVQGNYVGTDITGTAPPGKYGRRHRRPRRGQ
jgi:titin